MRKYKPVGVALDVFLSLNRLGGTATASEIIEGTIPASGRSRTEALMRNPTGYGRLGLERLVKHGYIRRVSDRPLTYEITPEGYGILGEYFRNPWTLSWEELRGFK